LINPRSRRRLSRLTGVKKMHDQTLLTEFGSRIRQLRTQAGLSQEELAEKTGFHRTYIGMIERGERNLSLSNIGVFAETFEMSMSELLDFDKPAKKKRGDG
jgi:transcriptional regulator with XRE-family HTH domain